jgi:two-component system, NarL family, nitrate/nitrite response regulator NarL
MSAPGLDDGRRDDVTAAERPATAAIRLYIASPIRIYREGLAHVLSTHDEFVIVGSSDAVEAARPRVRRHEVDVLLYDLRCPSGLLGLRQLADAPTRGR